MTWCVNSDAGFDVDGRDAMNGKAMRKSVAYLRTSSTANVGPDKDSERRQREAVGAFARSTGYEIVESYYDAAVSGADPVAARPGFSAMLERLLSNGVRTPLSRRRPSADSGRHREGTGRGGIPVEDRNALHPNRGLKNAGIQRK